MAKLGRRHVIMPFGVLLSDIDTTPIQSQLNGNEKYIRQTLFLEIVGIFRSEQRFICLAASLVIRTSLVEGVKACYTG